ncbi:hypothetical protein [Pseudoalteromonas sp. TB64]|uniref:hypothetical protein n=1 Tax=Pseudoalteromonas sp. TB64 TaxID=1938600 RepID=UPI000466E2D8|nr:hypothetical protein [Pseudoalteromonas sp. TB64]
MTFDDVIEKLKDADFAEAEDISKGLSSGAYQLTIRDSDAIKCRCFLLPIRSKISVLERQFIQSKFILKKIMQSKQLVDAWKGKGEADCKIFRVELNKEQYYMVFYDSISNHIFGALIEVNKPFEDKHCKRIATDL